MSAAGSRGAEVVRRFCLQRDWKDATGQFCCPTSRPDSLTRF